MTTRESIKAQLQSWGLDLSRWRDAHRALESLAREVNAGETVLDDEARLRRIKIARMVVRDDQGRTLIEHGVIEQGVFYARGREPAEKAFPGESPEQTGTRGLCEELAIDASRTTCLSVGRPFIDVQESRSYPGLVTEYAITDVSFRVEGLPTSPFWTVEDRGDRGEIHLWTWS